MRKIFLSALLILFVAKVSAQESIVDVAQERMAKLVSMTEKEVKDTGNKIIDNYTDSLYDLTDDVVENGKSLTFLTEQVKNGIVSKASALIQADSLSAKMTDAASKIKTVAANAKSAASQVKKLKSTSLRVLATKTLSNNTMIASILGEETASQIKSIGTLISLLKD